MQFRVYLKLATRRDRWRLRDQVVAAAAGQADPKAVKKLLKSLED